MAIVSIALNVIASVLIVFVSQVAGFALALAGFVSAIKSISKIKKSKGRLVFKIFSIAITIISSLQVVIISYWAIDAPPVPNDYTISDLRTAPPEYHHTYELLRSLANDKPDQPGAPAIGLSQQDVSSLMEIRDIFYKNKEYSEYSKISQALPTQAEKIRTIWLNAEKGRNIITQLSSFPEIADLSEPSMKADFPWLKNFRPMIQLYQAYICSQICQGNEQVAVDELIKLDIVLRKLSVNARSTITKLVCIGSFALNIETANFIANNPQTSEQSLRRLATHFEPVSTNYLSMHNPIIFEYLNWKSALEMIHSDTKWKYSLRLLLKSNSSFRLYKNFCDRWIAADTDQNPPQGISVWPSIYPDLPVAFDANDRLPLYYKVYNPIGGNLAQIMIPAIRKMISLRTRLQIHFDLLRIVLNKRLGKEVSLKARAYSDTYLIDTERKIIFSPGPDQTPYTKDDIKLSINPEVLNLRDF